MWKHITNSSIRSILALTYIVGCFVYLYLLLFKKIPADNKDIVIALGGVLVGGCGPVLGYYFGDSKRNEKTKNNEPDA